MQAMTFNHQGIGEFMRLDSSGNVGIGSIGSRLWNSEPGVMASWTVITADQRIGVWLDQHAHSSTPSQGGSEWSLTQDQYVMFLLRWGDQQ